MKRYLTAAAFAAIAAAGTGYWMSQQASGPVSMPTLVGAAEASESQTITEMTLGDPDAKVHVIEYASFTCPHCANFEQSVLPEIRRNYIDEGKIRFTFRDVYFDRYGLWASMVARCDPMRYFGVQNLLFEDISGWAGGEPAQVADNLRKIGRKAGLTDDQVNACLQDADKAQELVAWWEANSEEHGINSTPSFIIDGEKYSNMPYEDFAKILDEKLAE
ncbi:DsbA family protein [Tropicimonas sp. IMCC6043]|uniref:DsbA family protein n=1 Tax=Tropicimonas sp. IMCC6043 TaxID=2510645 RepID=UPI00101CA880|nr:DsbA family protein [Tropicimonas sp. IMCC6043]RYH09098.1 DsbA family protein [Tropicimonas sp. IMCC6043]